MRIKRPLIFLTTALLATTGFTLKKNDNSNKNYLNHINKVTNNSNDDDFLISAHRGFSSLEIENTSDSISLASKKDYIDYIEIDAIMTLDNKIVLSHNNIVFTDNIPVSISSLSYECAIEEDFNYQSCYLNPNICINPETKLIQKRKRKLNNKTYNLIGLKEGLELCGDKKVLLDIKFKDNKEEFTEELIKELDGIDTSNIIFQSLDLKSLKYFKEQTNYNCLALINNKKDYKYLDDFDNFGFKYTLLDYNKVEKLIKEDKTVAVWTINTEEDIDEAVSKLKNYYNDVIYITDNPDIVVTNLHDKQKTRD